MNPTETVTKSPKKSMSFKSIQPRALELESERLIETEALSAAGVLPLVIRPAVEGVELVAWARANRRFVEDRLLEHGALLFRGFDVDSAESFESFAAAVCDGDLFNENGEHPRDSVSGKVYTPVFYPPEKQLLWHNENSFNHRWPRKIWFCCMQPAASGGETPLVDSREVYRRLDPALRRPFEDKGVMYVRNYGDGLGLDWRTVFQADSREQAEARLREQHMEAEWKDGDRLRTRCVRPAVIAHPRSGERSWFNQAQHFHVACLDADTRRSLEAIFAPEDLPRNCYYGDGTPIEDSVMAEILGLYRELEVVFPWRRGDVAMVDNVLAAHGRNPFTPPRKILVAMAEMTNYSDLGA